MKRILSLFISAIILLSLDPQAAFADGTPAATSSPKPTAGPTAAATAPTVKSPTTGLPVTTVYHPINIQVENSPGARPQAGLSQADIVYECLMEKASVTRFQAVFNDTLPKNVGPVRSCRLYFVDIAAEYKGILAFFGGPTETVANIFPKIEQTIKDGNLQFAASGLTRPYGKLYWRISQRRAPHNVYTNLEKTVALYKKTPTPVSHFQFNAAASYSAYPAMNTVEVQYTRGSTYHTKYVYDSAAGNYKRYLAGNAFTDANTKKQITVKNIIVQRAVTSKFDTKKGHMNITLIGSGKADVYVGGKHIAATWERPTQADITRFYDANRKEIQFHPGNTWVQVIPSEWEPHIVDDAVLYNSYSTALNEKVGVPAVTAKAISYNSAQLTWGKVDKATRYEVYRADSTGGAYKLLATTAALKYVNRGIVTGTAYSYKVRAFRLIAGITVYGDYSPVVTATAKPLAPAAMKAAVTAGKIRVTWGAVAGKTKYELYRSTAKDGSYQLVATVPGRSYTDKAVTAGMQYFYKVRAYRLAGANKIYSEYSAVAAATVPAPKK